MSYINAQTNEYPVSENQIRLLYSNTSFATPFQAPEEYAVVFLYPQPTVDDSVLQTYIEIAPELTSKGHWEQRWQVVDIFKDYVDEEGNVITKAEQEAAAIERHQDQLKNSNKQKAIELLKQTDWVEIPSTSNVNFIPHLSNYDEFMTYRLALRIIAVKPTYDAIFPEVPSEQWILE